jgi:uncharacterized membrane protein YhaH (DUF805 family)
MEAIKNGYSNWSKFNGRTSREEYWAMFFYTGTIQILLIWFFPEQEAIYSLWILIHIPVNIGLLIRRMHDVGAGGFWCIVPIIGIIYSLSKSQAGNNQWGANPLGIEKIVLNKNVSDDIQKKTAPIEVQQDEKIKLNIDDGDLQKPDYLKTEDEKWIDSQNKTNDQEIINSSEILQEMSNRINELENLIENKIKILKDKEQIENKRTELEDKIKKLEGELSEYE